MNNEEKNTTTAVEVEPKRVNPTWEAFGRFKGCITILDSSILD